MASDLNTISLIGRLVRDAELKYLPSGTAVLNFSIANGYSVKRDDEWQDSVNFFNCVMFGKRSEGVHQYLVKGKQIGIQGILRQERWEKDGQPRNRVVIHVYSLQLLGGKKEENQVAAETTQTTTEETTEQLPKAGEFDDGIPF